MPQSRRCPIRFVRIAVVASVGLLPWGGPPASAAKPPSGTSTGKARMFMVNPVQSSGDQSLSDQKDIAAAVPQSTYAVAELRNLDGSGTLSGLYVNVRSNTGKAAYSADNTFMYDRSQDDFEQVMAYFWVNQAQEYLISLGFGQNPQLPGILSRPYDVRIDQWGVDNSFMTDKKDLLRFGKGGVDDAEDAEVIVHEYGHAVQNDQVKGFGTSLDGGSIGESFGDYFAVSVGLDAAQKYGWPVQAESACPMDWDATSYTGAPHCIRRFDLGLTLDQRRGEVHFDGQIWSQALWEIRGDYVALGIGTKRWDTTLIAAQFDMSPTTTFAAAAEVTTAKARSRDGKKAADAVRARFAARGINF